MKVKCCLFWESKWHCRSHFSSTQYLELLFSFCHSCEVEKHCYPSYKRWGTEMLGWNKWRPEPKSDKSAVEELSNLYCISFWECLGFYEVPQHRLQFSVPYLCDNDLPSGGTSFAAARVRVFPDAACSTVLVSAFHWFSTPFESCHILVSFWWTCVSTSTDFFPGAVLLKWFCLWRLWLESLPSSLRAVSGWHVPRDVIASKGVKIKSLGGCGAKAACVHTVWNLMFSPSPLH